MSRLVFICPDVPGGVRTYVSNLSAFLTKKNIDHATIAYGQSHGLRTGKTNGDLPHSTRLLFSRYATPQSMYRDLAALCREDDILIANDSFELDAMRYAGKKNMTIFTLHGDLKHYDSILQRHATFIDGVFCVSNGLRDKYSKLYPGLSFSVCHPMIANVHPEIGPQDQTTLTGVYIGRFEYLKGADTFLEVVSKTAETGLPIRWQIFTTSKGSDPQLLDKLSSSTQITFDLPNETLLEKIKEADLLLFPSRTEGFGIVVLECMKRGVVPIARNIPIGVPDMVKNGESGYLADEAGDIIPVLETLNADRNLLRQMKEKTAAFAATFFDCEKTGEHFLSLIGELRRHPARPDKPSGPDPTAPRERQMHEAIYRVLKYIHNKTKQ